MTPARRAAIAFLFHAPGLYLARCPPPPRVLRENAVYVVLTLAATAVAALRVGAIAAVATFLVGHFAWSARFAWLVSRPRQ